MRRKKLLPLTVSFLILALVFSSIGFLASYYKYSGQLAKEKLDRQKEQELLQALIRAQEDKLYNFNKNNDKDNELSVSKHNDTINKDTELIYKTLYTQCEDIIEDKQEAKSELIGLNKDGFKEYLIKNQIDWEIESFSKENVVLLKQVNKTCPNHYLLSVNKGYIAIYKFNEDSTKELIENTDIPINILPNVDQEKLQKGILVNTMKEINELLEDFSS